MTIIQWDHRALYALLTVLLAVIAMLFVAAMTMRWLRESRQRAKIRFEAQWEPLLYARMDDPVAVLPELSPREVLMFLPLWLRVAGYVRGEAEAALLNTAMQLGIKPAVLALVRHRSQWKRLLAMRSAGALRLTEALPELRQELARHDPRTSLPALAAMFRIDAVAAEKELQTQLSILTWSPEAIAELIVPAGEHALPILAKALANAPPRRAARLVRVIEAINNSAAAPILRERLKVARGKEEIAALLRALGRIGEQQDRETARQLTGDSSPLVRMQAAVCLGHLGTDADVAALLPLLCDRVWWVRYRAAIAIATLLKEDAAQLQRLISLQTDPYASEVLARAAAQAAHQA